MLYHKPGKQKRNNLQHIILRIIYEQGPQALEKVSRTATGLLHVGRQRKIDPRYNISRAAVRMIEKGLLKIEKQKHGDVLVLTKKGVDTMNKIKYGTIEIKQPKHWDGKWRLVIYDIKEERKSLRVELKNALRNIGFVAIQKSVWAYPFPCEDLHVMLKIDFKLGREVLYVVVDKLENDKWARDHFHLEP